MKTLLTTLCIILLFFSCKKEADNSITPKKNPVSITYKVNSNQKHFYLVRPFEGKFNYLFSQQIDTIPLLNLKTSEIIDLNSNLLFIEPGESYTIENNFKEKTYYGKNEQGQLFLNTLKTGYLYNIAEQSIQKNTLDVGLKKLDSVFNLDYQRLETLYKKKLVSKIFYNRIFEFLNHRKTFAKSRIALRTYMRTQNSNTLLPQSFPEKEALYWEKLYHEHSINDPRFQQNSYWFEYADYYVLYYNLWYKQGLKLNYEEHYKTYFTDYMQSAKEVIEQNDMEYFTACFLNDSFSMYDYEKNLMQVYTDFIKEYPNSKYTTFLKNNFPVIEEYQTSYQNTNFKNINFKTNLNEIHNLQQLIAPYTGQKIYLYVWKSTFPNHDADLRALKKLEPFFKEHHIKTIFISIDSTQSEDNWKDVVQFYNLKGSHIRASKELILDINKSTNTTTFSKSILIQPNGTIKNINLPERSSYFKKDLLK